MTAVCALVRGRCWLTAAPSLAKRPIQPLIPPLQRLGIACRIETDSSVTVHGGSLKGSTVELPGNISSQYVSALLFISPFAEGGMTVRLTTPLESWPYVLMTLECLEAFGIRIDRSDDLREFRTARQNFRPARYRIEGDWSSASYLLAAGAIAGETRVENLNPESLQADKKILDLLRKMGTSIDTKNNSITVRKSELSAIQADITDCIDLLPTMAVLAASANGTSELTGIGRARIKESDRVAAVKEGLGRMGIDVTEEPNKLSITGSPARGAVIDSNNDHRIAMAFSLLGLTAGDTVIENAECVSKTYPEFWDILGSIGGKVKTDG
jgi:3-phosphoshikimate 1-carboxyvinyltransferase